MDGIAILGLLVAFAIGFWIYILLPMGMAQRRGRSGLGWIFISLVFSPLFAIVLLMVLGPAQGKSVSPS